MISFLLWLLALGATAKTHAPAAPPMPRAREPRPSAAARAQQAQRAAQQAAQQAAAQRAAQQAAQQAAAQRAAQQAAQQAAAQRAAQQAQQAARPAPKKKKKKRKTQAAPAPAPAAPKKKKKKKSDRVTRANLVKIPGQWWIPWAPAPSDLTALAQQKLEELWQSGEGTTRVIPLDDGRIVGLLAIQVDGERGVSVWRLRPGTVIPEGVFPPREEVEQLQAEAEPEPVELEVEELDPVEVEEDEIEIEDVEEPQLITHLPVLMQGSSSPDVTTLQRALGMSGSLGFFGPSTRTKVEAFQAANGLKVDGIVGPETWTALLT